MHHMILRSRGSGEVFRNVGIRLPLLSLFSVFLFVSTGFSVSPGQEDPSLALKRQQMVDRQIASRGISDKGVLEAMSEIPRHLFVLPRYIREAYEDYPLPIAEGQTITQPYIVALMSQSLELRKKDKVLEIGTGSGYQAAVLARCAAEVFSIEIRENLARTSSELLTRLGYENVQVKSGDGYFGWEEEAPFDAIIVTCAANHVPPPLLKQLKQSGRLIIPLGSTLYFQTLTLITKRGGRPEVRQILDVRFVPMTGEMLKRKRP